MMRLKSLITNFAFAAISQGIALFVSILMSLFVPKVLGVADYGLWQLFIFYSSYVGFFGLGSIDGLYLIMGGTKREGIDKKNVASQLVLSTVLVTLFSTVVVLGCAGISIEDSRFTVILFTGVYAILSHIVGSFGLIFQAMNETLLYSKSVMVDRVSFLIPMLILVAVGVDYFEPYIIAYILSKAIALGYCIHHGSDIFSEGFYPLATSLKGVTCSIKAGFPLMIAGIADMAILGVARVLVDATWGIEAFGKVSFSLSMVNFFIVFVSQASMVLFPALRQASENEHRVFYITSRNLMEIALPAVYVVYYPVILLLGMWLPQYADSMVYFALLLPICVFNTKNDICCTTLFKVLRKERLLLGVNCATVVGSALLSTLGVMLFNSLDAVLIGAVICIVCRALWSEIYLNAYYSLGRNLVAIEEIALTLVFVSTATLLPGPVSTIGYLFLYGAYCFANRNILLDLKMSINRLNDH